MNIGDVAARTGVSSKTIRYYERIGLIPEAPRTEAGYRDYSENDVAVLKFVQRARHMGFPVKDVGELLNLWSDRERTSAQVKELTERHIEEVETRINELESIRQTLLELSEKCHGDHRPDCPILEDFARLDRK